MTQILPQATDSHVAEGEFGPTCTCGALIEEIDSGDGYTYWAHVKRMRIEYDHSAVPQLKAVKA